MEEDLVIYSEDTNEVIVIITPQMELIMKKGFCCGKMSIDSNNLMEDLATGQIKYIPKKNNIIYLDDYR